MLTPRNIKDSLKCLDRFLAVEWNWQEEWDVELGDREILLIRE